MKIEFKDIKNKAYKKLDFEILLKKMIGALDVANEIEDGSTIDLLIKMVKQTEKNVWMFNAYKSSN